MVMEGKPEWRVGRVRSQDILKTGAEEQCGLEALQEATIGIL